MTNRRSSFGIDTFNGWTKYKKKKEKICFLPSQYLIYYTTVLCCVCIYVGCLSLYTVGSDPCVMSVARQPWSETVGIFSFLFLIPLSFCVSVCERVFLLLSLYIYTLGWICVFDHLGWGCSITWFVNVYKWFIHIRASLGQFQGICGCRHD